MPEKNLRDRVRRAKRDGRTVAVKDSDLGGGLVSRYAGRKPRHVVAYSRTASRNARPKPAPGDGRGRAPAMLSPVVERPADSVPRSGARKSRYGRMGGIV